MFNYNNKVIDNIVLLTDRLYSEEELGVSFNHLTQVIKGDRVSYKDVLDYIYDFNVKGYIIFANTDVFFDSSLRTIKKAQLPTKSKMFTLLRHEFSPSNIHLDTCKLFGPRPDSQDAWIWHTNTNITEKQRTLFNFKVGVPFSNCKLLYLLNLIGISCYNEPLLIKCYQYIYRLYL